MSPEKRTTSCIYLEVMLMATTHNTHFRFGKPYKGVQSKTLLDFHDLHQHVTLLIRHGVKQTPPYSASLIRTLCLGKSLVTETITN